jgi:hypothetical protein
MDDLCNKTLLRDAAEVNPVRTPGARPTVKTVATPTQKRGMQSSADDTEVAALQR